MTDLKPIRELMPDEERRERKRGRSPDDAQLTDKEEIVLELVHVGVGLRKAESLVNHYSEERIRRQLKWLPLRGPRRPASLLISAIEHDYGPPAYADES
jgi:hypothetical protein